ncbi:MAG TPA: (d)CMP kinase [Solirubrobacteraceae bacterium]
MLIAIDGPAGAGKSTVARTLASQLGYRYLDSGAMYRCVAMLSLEHPRQAPAQLARAAQIDFLGGSAKEPPRVICDGRDVSEAIRAPEVSEAASRVAADPAVREALVAKQRAMLAGGDWIAEGRDIGTVVAPDADLKVFLSADAAERARRRATELGADPTVVLAEQALRDERDSNRAHSPLRPADGAVVLDTTRLGVEQVVQRIIELAREAPACASAQRPQGNFGGLQR